MDVRKIGIEEAFANFGLSEVKHLLMIVSYYLTCLVDVLKQQDDPIQVKELLVLELYFVDKLKVLRDHLDSIVELQHALEQKSKVTHLILERAVLLDPLDVPVDSPSLSEIGLHRLVEGEREVDETLQHANSYGVADLNKPQLILA